MFLAFSVLVAACGTEESTGGDPGTSQTAEMMAAALVELVTEDHGFGEGSPPFTEYLIQNRIDTSAGNATASPSESARPLTDAEREAIEEAVSEYGVVRWIDDPSDWQPLTWFPPSREPQSLVSVNPLSKLTPDLFPSRCGAEVSAVPG